MSKKIECRLPDELYDDLRAFATKQGITVTDVVIAGINGQLQVVSSGGQILKNRGEQLAGVESNAMEPVVSALKTVMETVYDIPPVKPVKVAKVSVKKDVVAELLSGIQAKSEGKAWFRPCPKESQTRNAGKGK